MNSKLEIDLEKGAKFLKSINKQEIIRLISHLDSDGICAAAIMVNALRKQDRRFKLTVLNQLGEKELEDLSSEELKHYIFMDLGSGQLESLSKKMVGKNILILDHHDFDRQNIFEGNQKNILHINPFIYGYDCNHEISGSGIVYLFSKVLDKKNIDMSHIALIGAIGDSQENNGFFGLNSDILNDAKSLGIISTEEGIKWFGVETKPLVKLMSISTDIKIPGVTGSEERAIGFLKDLGIPPRGKTTWRKYTDLTVEEKEKLAKGIIEKRKNEETPEDITGLRYILNNQDKSSPFRDAKEFSTLLNACGRLGHFSVAVGVCLDDIKSKKKADEILKEYRRKITEGISWYEENKFNEEKIILKEGYIIINARDELLPTIIGTISSIVSYSGYFPNRTFILSMARIKGEGRTKVSLRCSRKDRSIDLREVLSEITRTVDGESGGHMNAAGGIIPSDKETVFLNEAGKILEKYQMMESVN